MKDLLDILFDRKNCDPIIMTNQFGKRIALEQVFVMPYKNKIYAILKPIGEFKGIQDDEALVFYVDFDDSGELYLNIETDYDIAQHIFDEYWRCLANSRN